MPRRWLGARAAGGAKFKYHYSVLVDEVVLRAGVVAPPDASFRIAWKRGDKLATTRARAAEGGRIKFDETLALVCTMYRDTTGGGFDAKEATFTLLQQQGHKGETRKMARVSLDLSSYASVDPVVKECGLVLLHDGVPVGDAKLTISCRWLRNYSRDRGDDAESMVSGTGSDRSDACSSYYGRGSGSGSSCASVGSSASSFSIAGASEAGSDVGKMSELDTDDELEEAGRV